MWLPAERLRLSRAQRLELTSLARDPRTPKRVAARALIVLGAGGGASNRQLAQTLAVSRPTVIHWRRRFEEAGVAGLLREAVEMPKVEPAKAVRRQPDVKWLELAGIYVSPPDQAVAFSLEIAEAGEPAAAAPLATAEKTGEYLRHGAATLFAGLEVLGETAPGPMSDPGALLEFLERLDRQAPPGLAIHLIVGPEGAHAAAQIEAWLGAHARFHVHCTPAGGSWIHLSRRWWLG